MSFAISGKPMHSCSSSDQLRNLLRVMKLESRKKSENYCSCKSAARWVCFAGRNTLVTCGHGFGWANGWSSGCGLVRCGWISRHTSMSYCFPEILYAPSFSAYLVLIAPENTLECSSTCHLYSTMLYRSHCCIPMFLPVPIPIFISIPSSFLTSRIPLRKLQ